MRWQVTQTAEVPQKPVVKEDERVKHGMKFFKIENLTLVTPMVGGGVESLTPDQQMLIRGQSIRGQLRFWWRTFQDCQSVSELRQLENSLWGSTEEASKVSVQVELVSQGTMINYPDPQSNLPKYVLFPLDNDLDRRTFTLRNGVRFHLTVNYPKDQEKTVKNTLKLWLLFGGAGARTRRGTGSIYSPTWPGWKKADEITKWLQKLIPEKDQQQRPWPTLIGGKLLMETDSISPQKDIQKTWNNWIGKYQTFRQYRVDKNTGKFKLQGKSTWPEPRSIRNFHKSGKFDNDAFFPRGAYGLPILFHFPQEKMDYTFYGENAEKLERWASPVIFKVFKLNEHNALRICLQLESPLPESWKLEGHHRDESIPDSGKPMAHHPARKNDPLNDKDPYTALFQHMSKTTPITLGAGGKK